MNDRIVEQQRGDLTLSTDRARIDVDAVLAWLVASHWGGKMTRPMLERAIENSVCFGVYHGDSLIGLGRVISDLSTYAYWTDVVIAARYRGQGLGRWLSECMLAHPGLQGLRRVALLTRDAEALYAGLGFTVGPGPLVYMEHRDS